MKKPTTPEAATNSTTAEAKPKPSRLKSQLRRRRLFLGAMGGGRIGVGLIACDPLLSRSSH